MKSIFIKSLCVTSVLMLFSLAAFAKWEVYSNNNLPEGITAVNGSSHIITDGNWIISVYRYADDNWYLSRYNGYNGTGYIAGSGILDLRNLAEDCGVVLKGSNNGALEKNNNIIEVYFPDTYEVMVGNTFKDCKNLVKVDLGANFRIVGSESFRFCSALKEIVLPETIEKVDTYGFNGCSSWELIDYTFPESLKEIKDHSFTGCTKFSGSITFPGLTAISGSWQFEDCASITSFSAPKLTTTAYKMFNRCSSLKTVAFSPDLEILTSETLNDGPDITSFYPTVMPKLKEFGYAGLRGRRNLVGDFDLSQSSLTNLPKYAFVDCEKVGTVKLPETLVSLGEAALGYGKNSRVVWFMGPPPAMDSDALNPKGGDPWVLVGGVKYVKEWEESENLLPFDSADEKAKAYAAIKKFNLNGVVPVGKWKYQTGGYTHYVGVETPKGSILIIR